MISENRSPNTIKGYLINLRAYLTWFYNSFGKYPDKLYRENVLDYKSFLINNQKLNAKTVNHKLSSLSKFNDYLREKGVQKDQVLLQKDLMKVQQNYASPTKVTENEVKAFIQVILEKASKRDYALVTMLACTGLRISEALSIKIGDINIHSRECIVRSGKGAKQRIVPLNEKVIHALNEYLKNRVEKRITSEYLFPSNRGTMLDRSVINETFKKHSDKITPHQLRHFFCTNALEKGLGIHEVANIAGHTNIHTTMIYTNPDRNKLKQKMDLL